MKKYIFQIVAAAALALGAWSCETDYYNEHYLDGYEPGDTITDVQTIEYTLTDSDYSSIASNSTNVALAAAAGEEATAALKAIGTNKYFANEDDAANYLPAFLANLYKTVDNNSVVMVTYTTAVGIPAEMQAMKAPKTYTLTADDYKKAWGSEENFIEALTPATIGKLASVISGEGVEADEYVAVTYKYQAAEPSFGGEGEEPGQPSEPTISNVFGSAKLGDAVEVTGYISAVSKQGPILTDNGGSLLLYGYSQTSDLKVGDVVKVSGSIAAYNKGFQIAASSATIEKVGSTEVAYPAAKELDGAALDALFANRTDNDYAQFVKVTGKVAVSGSNYNIYVDGAETAIASFYGITDEMKAAVEDGDQVTVYGYFLSISGGKYMNIVVSHLNEEPAAPGAGYTITNVLGSAKLGDAVEVTGYISAVSKQGPILTDNGGSLLLYGYNVTSHLNVGDVVKVSGAIAAYNKGFQIAAASATMEVVGSTEVTYPAATELTGAALDALLANRTDNDYAQYVKTTGKVAVSGSNYNIYVDGAETAIASFYGITDEMKAVVADGDNITIYGYFLSISGGKYMNIVATKVESATATYALTRAAAANAETRYGFFKYNGSSFADAGNAVLQHSDYAAMGQSYDNLTDPDQDAYLPKYLAATYPYAAAGDVKNVSYVLRKNSVNSWTTDEFTNNGSTWIKSDYFAQKTDQFRKTGGEWNIDRTLEINFLTDGTAEFKAFLQYCANWVYDNIDVKLGAPARDNAGVIISTDGIKVDGANPAGDFFVSSYGNNEWYAGTYAYYGEMNWRHDQSRNSYVNAIAAIKANGIELEIGIEDLDAELTDEMIVKAMMKNSITVFENVLHYMYPDVTPEVYSKVVLNVYNYFNSDYATRGVYTYTFDTVGTGEFKYVEESFGFLN